MSKMSQLHAHLNELGPIPEYPDDSNAPGATFAVANGDRYVALGRTDGRGVALLVAESCPVDLRDEFAVPADGIELRHGPLVATEGSDAGTCDVCNGPGTEDRPVVRSVTCGVETFAHGDHVETF